MRGYPLFLNLRGEPCLVFGGGDVAYRKVRALLKRGARVTCVSKEFCGGLRKLVGAAPRGRPVEKSKGQTQGSAPTIKLWRIRTNRIPSLNGFRLVIAATSDRNFNQRISAACRKKKILVNVVDDPELCDFYAPAIVERGPLQIAISTGGLSPLFAKRLRQALEKAVPPSTGRTLEKIGKMRRKLLTLKRAVILRPARQTARRVRCALWRKGPKNLDPSPPRIVADQDDRRMRTQ